MKKLINTLFMFAINLQLFAEAGSAVNATGSMVNAYTGATTAYDGNGFSGELIDCDEGELVWLDKTRVPDIAGWEGDKIFLQLMEQNAPFFHLVLHYDGDTLINAELDGRALPLPGWEAAL